MRTAQRPALARWGASIVGVFALLAVAGCSGGPTTNASSAGSSTTTPASSTTTTSLRPSSTTSSLPSTTSTSSSTSSTSTTSSTTTTTIDPGTLLSTLAEGDAGPDVVTLQRMLNNVTGTSLSPNGVFGPDTTVAVTNFQVYVGLEVTGVADHPTRTRLIELDAGRSTAVPTWPVPSIGNGGADGCQVAVVGDSLMAGAAALHERALADVGCASAVDGVGGRSLNFGWQCRIAKPDGSTPLLLVAAPEPGNTTCAPSGLEVIRFWAQAGALGDIVVVALGTNDAGIHSAESTWVSHWQQALDLTAGRPVVFLTTAARPGSSRTAAQNAYSAALRRWCDTQERCHLADWALTPAATDPASYVDAVHLRRVATEQRAAFIADAVRRLLTAPPEPDPSPLPATTTTVPVTTTIATSTTSSTTSSTTVPRTSTTTSTTTTVPRTTTTSTSTTSTTTTTAPPPPGTSSTSTTSVP